jgi:hypothetical protein
MRSEEENLKTSGEKVWPDFRKELRVGRRGSGG